jgi:hypothetical protein
MVARATNNLNAFGHTNGIAQDVEMFTIDGGATLANETNPGEAMDAITRCIEEFSNIIAVGVEDTAGAFRIMLHGGKWKAATLQDALRILGPTFNGLNVGSNNYDLSGATVADYVF